MGYFDRLPLIADNDCVGKVTSVRITFEAGHEDYRDRRSFAVTVTTDGEEQARFHLPYEHAQQLLRALAADMRADLRKLAEACEGEP
jgi:hypothetical protein